MKAPNVLRLNESPKRTGWWRCVIAISVIYMALLALSARVAIPPLVESDYAYQLLAADRLIEGKGFTSLQPVAPGQPWTWRYDWGFLTQWPAGYALLVAGVRWLTGGTTLDACAAVGCAAAALALVGWFAWLRRCAPRGLVGWMLAICGAVAAVSPALLLNPSTDGLLVAAIPWVMLLAHRMAEGKHCAEESSGDDRPGADSSGFAVALACGWCASVLVWLRYAAIFVPGAIVLALLLCTRGHLRGRIRRTFAFGFGAAIPVAAILLLNMSMAQGVGVQEQLNLGHSVRMRLEPALLIEAWRRWTSLGYYSHVPIAGSLLAILPALVITTAMFPWGVGRRMRLALLSPAGVLSLLMLVAGLGLIVVATALFGEKFNYVGLDRYYLPLRPLYFAVVVPPMLAMVSSRHPESDGRAEIIRHAWAPVARMGAIIGLLVATNWSVQQDWRRTLVRWSAAHRPVTSYGQWARCFTPASAELYDWLRAQASPQLVIVSNYHEFVALETGLPTLPVPPDRAALEAWTTAIRTARQVSDVRILFVIDDDNRWRDYWMAEPAAILRQFNLVPAQSAPATIAHWVYEPTATVIAQGTQSD